MRIKRDIRRWYWHTKVMIESAPEIYIADMTRRSQNVRGIEMTPCQQQSPDGKGMMDSLKFENPNILSVDFAIFDDHDFKNPKTGLDDEHCEGCLYPTFEDPASWVAFIEIKDCKPCNITDYKKKTKRQIFNVVKAFRNRKILQGEKVYGIISFPRKHVAFNDTLFGDMFVVRRYKHFTGINFYATNQAVIIDDLRIRPVIF